jgi:hypothetical protein
VKKSKDIQSTLKGKQIFNPIYIEQEVEEYSGNPCIEALPRIFDDKDVIEKLLSQPKLYAEETLKRDNVRYHLINRVKDFFLPLDNHLKIEHILSSIIRRGYISRNPASKEYVIRLNCLSEINTSIEDYKSSDITDVCKMIGMKVLEIPELQRPMSECASIIGVSGMGKTQTIERLLMMYPQVIYHSNYKDNQLMRTQISWLKIDCPSDGSIKTFCKMFFGAVDDVLGKKENSYEKTFGQNRNSAASMMIYMAQLACLHSVGVLIIDEIQHIIHPRNNPDEILNFLTTLINTIGVPIMLIGTPKVTKVLEKGLKNARRAIGSGGVFLDRMESTDEEWHFLMDVLWEYQWLRKPTEINDKLIDAIYFESQGIIAIAITLFILVQKQAIFEKKEEITIELIHRVASNDLRVVRKLIKAIRDKDSKTISELEDITIDVEDIVNNQSLKMANLERIREVASQRFQSIERKTENQKELIVAELKAINAFKHLDDKMYYKIANKALEQASINSDMASIKKNALLLALEEESYAEERKQKGKVLCSKEENYCENDLRKLYHTAKDSGTHVYEKLLEKDFIKRPSDDYEITEI